MTKAPGLRAELALGAPQSLSTVFTVGDPYRGVVGANPLGNLIDGEGYFETGLGSWGSTGVAVVERSSDAAHFGSWSMAVTAAEVGAGARYAVGDVTPGAWYRLTFSLYTPAGATTVTAGFGFYDAAGTYIGGVSQAYADDASAGWVDLELYFEAAAGAASAVLTITSAAVGQTIYLDDVFAGQFFPVGPAATWVDLGDQLVTFAVGDQVMNISRTRADVFDQQNPATGSLRLIDLERVLDPDNAASEYAGRLVPGVRLRLWATFGADTGAPTDQLVFTGDVLDFLVTYNAEGARQTIVEVPFTDALGVIAGADVETIDVAVGADDTTGERIERVLNLPAVNFSPARRDVDAGVTICQATTFGGNALELIQQAAETENGWLSVTRQGKVRFRDRHRAWTEATTFGTLGPLLFTDRPDPSAANEVAYVNAPRRTPRQLVRNRALVTRAGGETQTADDLASQELYGVATVTRSGLLMSSDLDAAAHARWLIARGRAPVRQFRQIVVELALLTPAQQAAVMALDVGNRVAVEVHPAGSDAPISETTTVLGVSHVVGRGSWRVTFDVRQLDAVPAFIVGDAEHGVVGTSTISY